MRVEANGAFDHRGTVAVLAAHRTAGIEVVHELGISRLLTVGGDDHAVTVNLDEHGATLTVGTADRGVHEALSARVAHWFDLEADSAAIDAALGADPVFADHVSARPGLRVTRCADSFEAVVQTVLGQQVTLAAARLFGERLVAAYGSDGPSGLRRYPRPAELAAIDIDDLRATLRITGARARSVHGIACFFDDRAPGGALPERAELAALYGIGPWTLDYLAVRAGVDADTFPRGDAVLRRTLAALGLDDAAVARWHPYRSYAAVRLWSISGALAAPQAGSRSNLRRSPDRERAGQ